MHGVSNVLLWNVFWNLQYEHCEGFLRAAGDKNLERTSIRLSVNESLPTLHQGSAYVELRFVSGNRKLS